jgi:hypothetical protein
MAYRLSIQQGVLMGRRSDIEAEARKRDDVVTSVSVGGAAAYIASGEIEVPSSAGVSDRRGRPHACKPAAMRDQEVEELNAEPYAHHWFGKTVGRQWSEPKSNVKGKS